MFRLNRKWLGNPCDFCIHNKGLFGHFGTLMFSMNYCGKHVGLIPEGYSCGLTELDDGRRVFNMHCPHYGLSIQRLEDAVYNKKQFSLTPITVCVFKDDGSWMADIDPLFTVIQSSKAVLADKKIRHAVNTALLKKHISTMQTEYSEYRKLDIPNMIGVGCGAWITTLFMTGLGVVINAEAPGSTVEIIKVYVDEYIGRCGWLCCSSDIETIRSVALKYIGDHGGKLVQDLDLS